jgi:hypothetical protein
MWVLDLARDLEAVTVQQLRAPSPGAAGAADVGEGLGEAVVLRGKAAACGWAPACNLTTNPYVALCLASLNQVGMTALSFSLLLVNVKGERWC